MQGTFARFCSPFKRAAAAQVASVCALAGAWINIEAVMAVTAVKVLRTKMRIVEPHGGTWNDVTMAGRARPFCEPVHTS